MARQIINTGSTGNDGTGDTLRITGTKINENFSELYSLLGGGDSGVAITSKVSLVDSGVKYSGLVNNTVLGAIEGASKIAILLPDSNGTVIVDSAEQDVYNKHLYNTKIDGDLRLHGVSGTGYYKFTYEGTVPAGQDRNVNFPALSDSDTLVFEEYTQTLVNKTLTEPTINSPRVGTAIFDDAGAEMLIMSPTASAVNELTIANAQADNNPTISASGVSTNIGITLNSKGTGAVILNKVAYSSKQLGVGDSDMSEHTFIVVNPSSPSTYTMENGTTPGELKIVANRGTADATLQSSNFAFGSTVTMAANALTQFIWEDAEDLWHLLGTDTSGPNITIA